MASLGLFFGNPHVDKGDFWAFFTSLISSGYIPEGYDPGCFYLLYARVFVELEANVAINFCGLRYHGGSPPRAPPGTDPSPLAYRMANVFYPPTKIVGGTGRSVMGAWPDGSRVIFPPEIYARR